MEEEVIRATIMDLKFLISFISSAVLLFTVGCTKTTEEPFSCDAEVDLVIEDCNELARHVTVPIAVLPFTDEREHENKPSRLKYCKWQECVVQDFNQVVTQAFQDALECSGATVTDSKNASLFLTGKILKFQAWACIKKTPKKGLTLPLEVNLELKDVNDTVLWTKTVTGESIKLRMYAKNQPLRSNPEIIRGYLYLVRPAEPWRMSISTRFYAEESILSVVNDLIADETFWSKVEP